MMTRIAMAQQTKPGNLERGWNDPPVFLHTGTDAAPTQPPPPRISLNKRVGHAGLFNNSSTGLIKSPGGSSKHPPLSIPGEAGSADTGSGVVILPPAANTDVPRFTAPLIVPTMNPSEQESLLIPQTGQATATNPINNTQIHTETTGDNLSIPNFDSDQQLYHFVITRLTRVLSDCQRLMQPRAIDDVRKKLDVLSTMWEDGKISYHVKSTMATLVTALHRRQCDHAHTLHLALMMDYVSEVGQWMVGIKRLIQEARNVEAPLSPTDTTVSAKNLISMPGDISQTVTLSSSEVHKGSDSRLPASTQQIENKAVSASIDDESIVLGDHSGDSKVTVDEKNAVEGGVVETDVDCQPPQLDNVIDHVDTDSPPSVTESPAEDNNNDANQNSANSEIS